MWFFPEGNVSAEVSPPSAFRVAIDKKVPVVPVVFSPHAFFDWNNLRGEEGMYKLCHRCFSHSESKQNHLLAVPGKVIIDILPSISTTEYTRESVDSLIEKTRALINRKHDELADEVRRARHAHMG